MTGQQMAAQRSTPLPAQGGTSYLATLPPGAAGRPPYPLPRGLQAPFTGKPQPPPPHPSPTTPHLLCHLPFSSPLPSLNTVLEFCNSPPSPGGLQHHAHLQVAELLTEWTPGGTLSEPSMSDSLCQEDPPTSRIHNLMHANCRFQKLTVSHAPSRLGHSTTSSMRGGWDEKTIVPPEVCVEIVHRESTTMEFSTAGPERSASQPVPSSLPRGSTAGGRGVYVSSPTPSAQGHPQQPPDRAAGARRGNLPPQPSDILPPAQARKGT